MGDKPKTEEECALEKMQHTFQGYAVRKKFRVNRQTQEKSGRTDSKSKHVLRP